MMTQKYTLMWRLIALFGLTVVLETTVLQTLGQAQESRIIRAPAPYNACNLRDGPGVSYQTIGTFRNGTLATFTGERSSGWYSVQVGTTLGWMARQCFGL